MAERHHGCLHLPELAATIQSVIDHGRDGFYEGAVASRIAQHVQASGGALSMADLAAHRGTWSAPLAVPFRGSIVHVQPPVSMGVLLLVALRLAERMAPAAMTADLVRRTDLLVGIKHTVFRRALADLGDPAFVPDRAHELLADAWIEASLFAEPSVAAVPGGGGDTTSIAVTDSSGTTISLIHSLFNEFGSRVLVPGTGLVLNDRLANLRTAPGPANALAGGKRPMHTLHSWVADLADGRVMSGATPGGRGQVQTNLQVLLGVIDDGLGLADAVGRPGGSTASRAVPPTTTPSTSSGTSTARPRPSWLAWATVSRRRAPTPTTTSGPARSSSTRRRRARPWPTTAVTAPRWPGDGR